MHVYLLTPELIEAINAVNYAQFHKIIICDHGAGPCIEPPSDWTNYLAIKAILDDNEVEVSEIDG
jgi:hypothetical protein